MSRTIGRVAAIAVFLLAQATFAFAAELKVISTPALSEVWTELKPKFEATGHKITLVSLPRSPPRPGHDGAGGPRACDSPWRVILG